MDVESNFNSFEVNVVRVFDNALARDFQMSIFQQQLSKWEETSWYGVALEAKNKQIN